jgi:branched-chain amino acid transport system substrate-binding protein
MMYFFIFPSVIMRFSHYYLTISTLIISYLSVSFSTAQTTAANTVLIGISMGAATPSGVSSVRSMRMAVEEINAAGGINGKNLAMQVEYGNAKDPQSMDSTIYRLIAAGATCIISGSGSGNTLRAAQIAVSKGVMLMTAASSSPRIGEVIDNNLVWRTIPSDIFQAHVAADLLQKKKHKTVGIIAINNAYGSALAASFAKSFQKAGGKIVASIAYPDVASYDTFNFKAKLDSLYAQKPSAIYLVSYNDDGAKIMNDSKGYVTANYKPFIFGCDGNYNNDFLLSADLPMIEGMEGLSYVHPMKYVNYDTFFAKFKEFSQRSAETSDLANISLANLLDVEATNSYAATSYDAIYTFALAALKAASTKPSEIAKQMSSISRAGKGSVTVNVGEFAKAKDALKQGKAINYEGASGPVEFDAKGDVTHGTYIIWRIAGGKFMEVGTVAFP